jgi:DNA-binding SARP family transcriptional activator
MPAAADALPTPAAADAALALRLLGVPAWRRDAGPWQVLSRKDALLLAALALGGPQSRSRMASWLWPGVPLPRAHANLRQRMFRLRRQGGDLIDESGEGLRLADAVRSDVWQGGCSDDADLAAVLLGGLPEDGTDDTQPWVDDTRRQWAARRTDLLTGLATRHEAAGALAAALAATEQLLALEPLLEHAWRRLMRLHVQRGDRAAALAAFERCEAVLQAELGVKPSPETLALLHRVDTLAATEPAESTALLAPALMRPPRLVGRQAERRAMAAAWQAGSAFVLVGEAGLGKSRLLHELAAEGPGRVLESARPGDEAVPYGALVRLLRSMARVALRPHRLWPEGTARAELARLLPELGTPPAAPGMQALLQAALEQVFRSAPDAGVQAVLLDDLHHADAATRAVLQRVVAAPGLWWGLATRPDVGPPGPLAGELADWLASSVRLQPVLLSALDDADLAGLLASLRLPRLDTAALAPALARHCGGNPLFVLETLKHLLLHGAQAGAADALPLPPSVQAVIAQRLQALSPPARALAHVAAVAGADFHAEVAADVLQAPVLTLAAPWAELQDAQVLRDAATTPQGGDVFAHEAVRDAVLRSLPQALRGPVHARVAASLARRGAPPQRVARHYAAAGDLAAAAPCALAAAALALRLGGTAERLAHLRQAADWFAQAGQVGAAFDARVASVEACLAHEGLAPAAALAAQLLPQATTPAQRLALRLAQAGVGLAGYDVALCQQAAAAALDEAGPGSDEHLQARVLLAAGRALGGDVAQAVADVQAVQAAVAAVQDPLLAAGLWGHCAVVHNANGNAQACVAALQQQQHWAQQAGHAELLAGALGSLSGQYTTLGDNEGSIRAAQDAARLHRRMQADHAAVVTELNLAMALVGASRLRDAMALLLAARRYLQASAGDGDTLLVVADLMAEIWLRAGCPQRALDELATQPPGGMNLARQVNRLALQAQAEQMLGHGNAALQGWQRLRALLPPGPGGVLRLRSRAMASVALAPEEALRELGLVLRQSQAACFPAGEALARMRRAAWALRLGDARLALADARALVALRPRARHVFVAEAEQRALVCQVLDATGHTKQARSQRAEAQAWVQQVVMPQLPEGCAGSWQAHPAHQCLFG